MAARNVASSVDSSFTVYNFPAAVDPGNCTLRSTAQWGMLMNLKNGLFFYMFSAIMLNVK